MINKRQAFLALMSVMLILCTLVLAASYSKSVNRTGCYIIELPVDSEESDAENKNRLKTEDEWNSINKLPSPEGCLLAVIIRLRDSKASLPDNKISIPNPPPELHT